MELARDSAESSVLEMSQALNQCGPIARNTLRILMERMEQKGWGAYRVERRSYMYSAVIPRKESLGQRVSDMLDKACAGYPEKPMMAPLQYRGLSIDVAKRIRVMLDETRADEAAQANEQAKQSNH